MNIRCRAHPLILALHPVVLKLSWLHPNHLLSDEGLGEDGFSFFAVQYSIRIISHSYDLDI